MDNSVLTSVKKMLGIESEYTQFDTDIIININSVMMTINQLGIGPVTGFYITGNTETWIGLIGERKDMEAIKTLVYLKVRLLFDPPSSAFVLESIQRQIQEFEWRLNVQAEEPLVET